MNYFTVPAGKPGKIKEIITNIRKWPPGSFEYYLPRILELVPEENLKDILCLVQGGSVGLILSDGKDLHRIKKQDVSFKIVRESGEE
jgi:hypothetical protein